MYNEPPEGGGGVLGYFHTYVGSGNFFWVQNFEFPYLWGMKILSFFFVFFCFVFFFWGGGGFIAKLDYIYGSFLCILGYFQNVPIK